VKIRLNSLTRKDFSKSSIFNTLTLWQGTDDRMATFHLHHLGLLFLLEATAIRMTAKDARTETYRILATFRVFHQAIRDIQSFPPIPSPTYFRIGKTPLLADCVDVPATDAD
jgi:hypothetical protein